MFADSAVFTRLLRVGWADGRYKYTSSFDNRPRTVLRFSSYQVENNIDLFSHVFEPLRGIVNDLLCPE